MYATSSGLVLIEVVCWVRPSLLDDYKKDGGALVQTKRKTASELREMVKSKSVNVLDVRRLSEFGEGYFLRQNIAHTRLASKLSEVPKRQAASCSLPGRCQIAYVWYCLSTRVLTSSILGADSLGKSWFSVLEVNLVIFRSA